jgi:hypothetical protein
MNLKYFENIDGSWVDISGQPGASLEYDEVSGWVTSGGYKKYVAILSQYGTSDPEVKELENTIDPDITIYRNEESAYTISSPNDGFTANKTYYTNDLYLPKDVSSALYKYIKLTYNDVNSIQIKTYEIDGSAWDEVDDLLREFKLEIRVYN